jgi:putative PEP-CTERM system histidine kinase
MVQSILSITAIVGGVVYPSYLLLRRERSLPALLLLMALMCVAAVELFDLLFVRDHGINLIWRQISLAAEGLMIPLWIMFSLAFARSFKLAEISRLQRALAISSLAFPVLGIWQPVDFYFVLTDFPTSHFIVLTTPGYYFYLGILVFLVIALINLEATLRAAEKSTRWQVKFEIIGAGAILAVLILFYSQGLLFRSLNMQLIPARSSIIILGLLLMAYSRIKRGGGVRIALSRKMALNSVVLLAVGLYLLSIGLLAGGMKHLGISFQDSVLVLMAFLSGLGLLILILSENIRRKARVLLHKHFFRDKYDYRHQWQEFTKRLALSKTRDELHQGVLSSFMETLGMGFGALYLKKHDDTSFSCAFAMSMNPGQTTFSISDDFIQYMSERKWLVDVHRECPDLNREQKELFDEWKIRFGVPLFRENEIEGFILLGNAVNPDETYTYEDYDLMKALASQASSAILNLHLAEQLAAAREMEAAGRVAAFILHDLKNLVYALSLMLENARSHIDNPEFQQDMLESLSTTVHKMNTLISQLSGLPETPMPQKHDTELTRLAQEAKNQLANERIKLKGKKTLVQADERQLHKVMVNLLVNALEADQGNGDVYIEVGQNNKEVFFRVSDSGCGIPEEFLRNRLFSPFMTTKEKGAGIGLYQCKRIVQGHGGRIEVKSSEGQGAEFTVWIPRNR